jgi:hypothetical protein
MGGVGFLRSGIRSTLGCSASVTGGLYLMQQRFRDGRFSVLVLDLRVLRPQRTQWLE